MCTPVVYTYASFLNLLLFEGFQAKTAIIKNIARSPLYESEYRVQLWQHNAAGGITWRSRRHRRDERVAEAEPKGPRDMSKALRLGAD